MNTSAGAGTAPVWVKIERRGTTLTSYRSADGSNWTRVGSDTVALGDAVYVGLAVTSHNASAASTATFEQVASTTVGTANQPPVVSLTAPANGATYTAPATISIAATASDADGSVTRVDFYRDSTLIATDTASPYSATWSSAPAGSYALTAVARDNGGNTTVSSTRTITITATAVPTRAVFQPSSNHDTAVDRYLLEIFAAGANHGADSPIATQDVGKPPVQNGACAADVARMIVGLSRQLFRHGHGYRAGRHGAQRGAAGVRAIAGAGRAGSAGGRQGSVGDRLAARPASFGQGMKVLRQADFLADPPQNPYESCRQQGPDLAAKRRGAAADCRAASATPRAALL